MRAQSQPIKNKSGPPCCCQVTSEGLLILTFSSLSNLRDLLPSRCNLGESFCEGTCNAIGRTGGKCLEKDGVQDCQCDETFLSGSQFALCGAESTCRLDCQRRGSVSPLPSLLPRLTSHLSLYRLASGECDGWNCVCSTNATPASSE